MKLSNLLPAVRNVAHSTATAASSVPEKLGTKLGTAISNAPEAMGKKAVGIAKGTFDAIPNFASGVDSPIPTFPFSLILNNSEVDATLNNGFVLPVRSPTISSVPAGTVVPIPTLPVLVYWIAATVAEPFQYVNDMFPPLV